MAIVDLIGPGWPPPERAVGDRIAIDVDESTLLNDAIRACAVRVGGRKAAKHYFWVWFLKDSQDPEPEYIRAPPAVIADDGQLLWTEGARDRVTFGHLLRTKERGFFDGDPLGVWLETPMYGDGVILDWNDLLTWMAALGTVGTFARWLKDRYERWQSRGARTPFAFLDLVLARDEWNRADLGQLLGLSQQETMELLESFGYESTDEGMTLWKVSSDPQRSRLRRQILKEQLHREGDTGEGGSSEGPSP